MNFMLRKSYKGIEVLVKIRPPGAGMNNESFVWIVIETNFLCNRVVPIS